MNFILKLMILAFLSRMAVVVTNAGEEFVVDKLKETISTECNYVGWGSGAGTAAKADTDNFTPVNSDPGNATRILGTSSKTGTGATAKYQVVATLQAVAGFTATNAGLFTAITAGTCVVHGDHTGVVLATGDQIAYTFTIDPS